MSHGIPKSVRDALARQTADEHLSCDLLNGYAERSLTGGEKERVANHLAVCGECREVVFFSCTFAKEELVPSMMAAATAAPASSQVAESAAPLRAGRGAQAAVRSCWSWKWAAPVAAGLALVFGFLIQHYHPAYTASGVPVPTVTKIQAPRSLPATSPPAPSGSTGISSELAAESAAQPKSNSPEQQLPAATGDKKLARQRPVIPERQVAGLTSPTPTAGGSTSARAAYPVPAGVEVTSALPLISGAEDAGSVQAQARAVGKTSFAGSNEASAALFTTPLLRAHWRVSPQGHLQRSLVAGEWTRVMADQPAIFRSVAVVGQDIWAGGNDGALFHSTDNGARWNNVVLTTAGNAEHGAITWIHFRTKQQGSLGVDSGATWTTSNGGQTWSRQ